MKKLVLACIGMILLCGCGQKYTVEDLKTLTFEELDQKIEEKEDMVVYFGWTENCGDSIHFQENYLEEKLTEDSPYFNMYVVNLDKELPEGLEDRDKREPMFQKYSVRYSPTLVAYKDGNISTLLEWTPESTDKETGILASRLDDFFQKVGYEKGE